METTFRFSSANEITEEFIEKIKSFYKNKAVSIIVSEDIDLPEEDDSMIPDWFLPELLERKRAYENGTAQTVSWDECKKTLLESNKK